MPFRTVFSSVGIFRWILASLAVVTIGTLGISSGQPSNEPIFLNLKGDLWVWRSGPSLTRLTNYGHNHAPIISPDGRWVAYSSDAAGSWGEKCMGSGPPASNIYILRTDSSRAERVASQPKPVSKCGDVTRTNPKWSPDSRRIAWSEHGDWKNGGCLNFRLRVLDMATRTVSSAKIPLELSSGETCDLPIIEEWRTGGLVFFGSPNPSDESVTFFRVAPNGETLESHRASYTAMNRTDEELYATRAPSGLSVFGRNLMKDFNSASRGFFADGPGQRVTLLRAPSLNEDRIETERFGISPDGKRIAFIEEVQESIWLTLFDGSKRERTVKLPTDFLPGLGLTAGFDGIAWGHLSWRRRSR
jgi:WD40-like Beta Propeller Repeat